MKKERLSISKIGKKNFTNKINGEATKPQKNPQIAQIRKIKPVSKRKSLRKDISTMAYQFSTSLVVFILILNYNGGLPTGLIINNKNLIKYSNIYLTNIFKIAGGFLSILYLCLAKKRIDDKNFLAKPKRFKKITEKYLNNGLS